MRYLILVALVLAVFWMLRSERRAAIRRRTPRPSAQAPQSPKAVEGEAIVGCAQCDLHLPVSEAIPSRDPALVSSDGGPRWFCCEAHRALFEKAARHSEPGVGR
ncbi:hypothetical protein BH09PSE5_BH09PSE5_44980 [soil metagenome]